MINRRRPFSLRRPASDQKIRRRVADERRGSSASRGYSSPWQRYRKIYLDLYPFCIACVESPTRTELIDHIIPVQQGDGEQTGASDPLFWAHWNHEPLCKLHHQMKTVVKDPNIISSRSWLLSRLREDSDDARRNELIRLSQLWPAWIDLSTGNVISTF